MNIVYWIGAAIAALYIIFDSNANDIQQLQYLILWGTFMICASVGSMKVSTTIMIPKEILNDTHD